MIQYHVEQGEDVQVQNNEAFIWSIQQNHLDVAQYLLKLGANIDADRNSALRFSVYRGTLVRYSF